MADTNDGGATGLREPLLQRDAERLAWAASLLQSGENDPAVLRAALGELIQSHEALSAPFAQPPRPEEQPVRHPDHDDAPPRLPRTPVGGQPLASQYIVPDGGAAGGRSTAEHALRDDFTARSPGKPSEIKLFRALESQSLLKQLLSLPIRERALVDLLTEALRLITEASVAPTQGRGAIFLNKEDGEGLEMAAQSGLPPALVDACRLVAPGHCLCGRAAASGELLFAGHVDDRHDNRFDGMTDHGHYCAPIRSGGKTLGLLTLYTPAGHLEREEERETLLAIGNTLGMIIERKIEERELAKLAIAVQHSPVAVFVTDPDGVVEYINEKFTGITGYPPEEALGRKTSLLASGQTDPEQYRRLWGALKSGETWDGVFLNRRKNGEIYWQRSSISPVIGAKGEIRNFVCVGEDITQQRKLLEERNAAMRLMRDSIGYAGRIQRSILPPPAALDKAFHDHFVLWEPRDVVGGDIYWLRLWGDGSLVILGDCTGHGVPGAFMTLISNGALDEAYLETPPGDPAALLQRMHQLIQSSLGQDTNQGGESDDGIELGACYLDGEADALTFAGARFDLFMMRNGEVTSIRGGKAGLGYRHTPYDIKFVNHRVELTGEETLYMTSDGLIDQIGGPKRRGFGKRRFLALIASLEGLPLAAQEEGLRRALREHQGEEARRDDISILGFKPRRVGRSATDDANCAAVSTPMVDCKLIDDDHRRLYGIVNKINTALHGGEGKNAILAVVEELIAYTQWHFRHEERLMQIRKFPGRAEHEEAHARLIEQVLQVKGDIVADRADVTSELLDLLRDWLSHHIRGSDQALADYLNELAGSGEDGTDEAEAGGEDGADRRPFLVLNSGLLVGYNAIDDDHKELARLMNQLHVILLDGAAPNSLHAILDRLLDYTAWHFRHEERLMQTHAYPEMAEHVRAHALLADRVADIQARLHQDDPTAPFELNALLKNWLVDHIHEEDSLLATFLLSRKSPSTQPPPAV